MTSAAVVVRSTASKRRPSNGALDLGVRQEDAPRVKAALAEFHRVDTGEWPRFLVLDDEDGNRVDLTLVGAVLGNARTADIAAVRERFGRGDQV